jgi:outer membrane receptor protein involved in Fe transport
MIPRSDNKAQAPGSQSCPHKAGTGPVQHKRHASQATARRLQDQKTAVFRKSGPVRTIKIDHGRNHCAPHEAICRTVRPCRLGAAGPERHGATKRRPAPEQARQPGIQDIIVTANKREENINKVGLSITAVSGSELKERQIVSLSDLASVVPGLSFAPSGNNTPIFTLRGVGFNESSLGVYPAVSVYVDQAPLPFPVMASHAAFDLERVEVLKGPQGTLFGENATGGAINYIAAKPTKSLQAGGDISYGRFNSIDANAYISGPLTDKLGFRIAATGSHMDDWQYSISRPGDTNGHVSFAAGRLLLDWKPTASARFELSVNGYKDTSQPQAQQLVLLNPQSKASPALVSKILSSPFAPNNARAANWVDQATDPATGVVNADGSTTPGTATTSDFRPFSNRTFWQIALRGDIDVTPDVTLTSMTSYDHFDQRQRISSDGNDIVSFDLQRSDGMIRTFNQELRLANSGHGALKWIVGGNFERTVTDENQLLRIFDNTAYNAANLYINASAVDNHQSITNWALFGNAEYRLIDRVTLIGGVRYTDRTTPPMSAAAPFRAVMTTSFSICWAASRGRASRRSPLRAAIRSTPSTCRSPRALP